MDLYLSPQVSDEEYNRNVPVAALYTCISNWPRRPYHRVVIYPFYSRAIGCHGEPIAEIQGTIAQVMRELRRLVRGRVIKIELAARMHERMSEHMEGVTTSELKNFSN